MLEKFSNLWLSLILYAPMCCDNISFPQLNSIFTLHFLPNSWNNKQTIKKIIILIKCIAFKFTLWEYHLPTQLLT